MNSKHGTPTGSLFACLLVLLIALQTIYLTKDLGWRIDLTPGGQYSLTASTKRILDKLKQPLVIEAYFSQDIPGSYEETRRELVDLLDEYVQIGGGKVSVVYYDPLSDESVRKRADRLGITEAKANVFENDKLSSVTVYQGLRVRYGGDRQQVLPILQNANGLEADLTPKIQELVLGRKPKVGFLVRQPTPNRFNPMARQPGFDLIQRQIRDRFEVVPINMSTGDLLPKDLEVLVIFQPKDLTDWEKYCIDQHVMHGGNLIVCEESADYSIDQYFSYFKQAFKVDAADAKLKWKDMLANYGVKTDDKLVSDLARPMTAVSIQQSGQTRFYSQSPMPYWFIAVQDDWSKYADPGSKLADKFGPGLDTDHPALRGVNRLPFFWATDVGLTDKLPDGIKGTVLARTSPFGLSEGPPMSSRPDPSITERLKQRVQQEPRKQLPLAVVVEGKFKSFFAGKPVPTRPGDTNGGLLAQDQSAGDQKQAGDKQEKKADESKTDEAKPAQAKTAGTKTDEAKPAQGKAAGDQAAGDQAAGDQAAETKAGEKPGQKTGAVNASSSGKAESGKQDAAATQGPPSPKQEPKKPERPKLPATLTKSEKKSDIVVIGDASPFRDDFLMGLPPQPLGPNSRAALPFFLNLLDWMALDTDLAALRAQRDVDRKLYFVSPEENLSPAEAERAIASRKSFLRWLNVLLPTVILLSVGLFLLVKRSSEKRHFLAGV